MCWTDCRTHTHIRFIFVLKGKFLRKKMFNTFNPSTMGGTMYRKHNGAPDGRYSVCTVEAILDNCFTEFVFCDHSCFFFGCIIFLTLSTQWKEMGIVEKEGGLPVLNTDILNSFFFFFFLLTAEITTQLTGKISAHLPAAEGLIINFLKTLLLCFFTE